MIFSIDRLPLPGYTPVVLTRKKIRIVDESSESLNLRGRGNGPFGGGPGEHTLRVRRPDGSQTAAKIQRL